MLLFLDICSAVDVDYIGGGESPDAEEQGLSEGAIIAIAVSSGVAGIAVMVAWIAVVLCCCVLSSRNNRSPPPPPEYKNEM